MSEMHLSVGALLGETLDGMPPHAIGVGDPVTVTETVIATEKGGHQSQESGLFHRATVDHHYGRV